LKIESEDEKKPEDVQNLIFNPKVPRISAKTPVRLSKPKKSMEIQNFVKKTFKSGSKFLDHK